MDDTMLNGMKKIKYNTLPEFYDNFWYALSDEGLNECVKRGCEKHVLNYIRHKHPNCIIHGKLMTVVSPELPNKAFMNEYLKKTTDDFDARDCAHLALNRKGIPPIDSMSIDSLTKTIRNLIFHNDNAYIKRVKGRVNTTCVHFKIATEIISHPSVTSLIETQTTRIKNPKEDSVEWRAYEFEKQKIAFLDSLNNDVNDNDYNEGYGTLSYNEKTGLMVEAIFGRLFSEYDFDKYEQYYNEMNALYDDWDFGERYQELYDIFRAKDYKNEFYNLKTNDDVIDKLADIIADKIIHKMKSTTS